jgi:hypothetical protein
MVLLLGDPVASLLRCEDIMFLCLGEVIDIELDTVSTESIPLDILSEQTVQITFQLLELRIATEKDDPTQKHDWRTNTIIHPVTKRVVSPRQTDDTHDDLRCVCM